jgi:hypothetical protein
MASIGPTADGSVPARLWQDPLAFVGSASKEGGGISAQPLLRLFEIMPKERAYKGILFLFVCVESPEYPEVSELRRRERFATLSALSTAGYVPTQADRISYVTLPREPKTRATQTNVVQKGGESKGEQSRISEGRIIPFEWMRPLQESDPEYQLLKLKPQFDAICALWLGVEDDSKRQLAFLSSMKRMVECALCQSFPSDPERAQFLFTGRINSSRLADIIRADNDMEDNSLAGVTLFVTQSTALFVRDRNSLPFKSRSGLKLEYVIGHDLMLAETLIHELRLRDIHPENGDRIAIIAERDTEYGRNMHPVFTKAGAKDRGSQQGNGLDIQPYSYLRGLDGKRPKERKSGSDEIKEGNDSSSAGDVAQAPTSKEAEGDPQVDYVRRLVQRMKSDQRDFKAIGVVGSDVYDKILLLKALRPSFPHAVFFTTDLDVRLLQPGDLETTRNLLIASHYGLALNDGLQGQIAPFRSGYDTSSYLGVLRAVNFDTLDSSFSCKEARTAT